MVHWPGANAESFCHRDGWLAGFVIIRRPRPQAPRSRASPENPHSPARSTVPPGSILPREPAASKPRATVGNKGGDTEASGVSITEMGSERSVGLWR